jgi:hypothetical protein
MNCPYSIKYNEIDLCDSENCPHQSKTDMIALSVCRTKGTQKTIAPKKEFLPRGLLINIQA